MANKEHLQTTIGKNLRRIRNEKGITLEQLALEAGIAYSQVSRLELGKINPTAYTLYLLASALKVPLTDFFAGCLNDYVATKMHNQSKK